MYKNTLSLKKLKYLLTGPVLQQFYFAILLKCGKVELNFIDNQHPL